MKKFIRVLLGIFFSILIIIVLLGLFVGLFILDNRGVTEQDVIDNPKTTEIILNDSIAEGIDNIDSNNKVSVYIDSNDLNHILHTTLEGMPKHQKVLHGDLCPSNIIISKDGTPYIIDWSHATQGNASADAARTYLVFWLNGDIEGARKYLDIFCKKSDTAKQYVQKWTPIVAASQSVKGKEKEREFLLSWVNVVDYE